MGRVDIYNSRLSVLHLAGLNRSRNDFVVVSGNWQNAESGLVLYAKCRAIYLLKKGNIYMYVWKVAEVVIR